MPPHARPARWGSLSGVVGPSNDSSEPLGGRTDAVFPPDLADRTAGIGLLQNTDDLGLGKLRLTHGNFLARVAIVPESSPFEASQFGGSLRQLAGQ